MAKWGILAVLLTLSSCNQNMKPIPEGGAPPVSAVTPPMAGMSEMPAASRGNAASGMAGNAPAGGGGGETVSGTITVTPDLTKSIQPGGVMFIMARRGGGPPLAVKRVDSPTFPYAFTLTSADQMVQGTPFSGPIELVARLDRDGNAGPPQSGDLEGNIPDAHIGDSNVKLVINKAF